MVAKRLTNFICPTLKFSYNPEFEKIALSKYGTMMKNPYSDKLIVQILGNHARIRHLGKEAPSGFE
jgi:hypothetical protein